MATSEERINEVTKRAQENANLIWNAANSLFGAFKPHEYGLVILPMCVIKRFHDCLETKKDGSDKTRHQEVLEANEKYKDFGEMKADFLKEAAGYPFYNTSDYTFKKLVSDPENIDDNFRDFLNGFSDNVQQILSRMSFFAQIDRMVEAHLLYQVISDFNASDMDMSGYSAVDMGYIFENLVQRFSESYNEEAGAHFTSRDIIYLMCDLLLTNGEGLSDPEGMHCTVYDMTMGTSQMLTCMEERIKNDLDKNADVKTFGQEINPFTMGIAVADTMIRGSDPDNMKFGDTLSDDQFSGYEFDYVISNPPFGIDWKREAKDIENEHKKGENGRFAPGLPAKSDGQMLFLLNGVKKLKTGSGKMAIIQNGSSLFNGDAGSGQSEIRRYLIENDWLDTIVQLPTGSFYNTPIATYVWIIDKTKPTRNPGKVQLIDASQCSVVRKRNIGSKRVDISNECRDLIVKAYGEYQTADYEATVQTGQNILVKSKVMNSLDLGYSKVIIETPLRDEAGKVLEKKGKPVPDTNMRDSENIPLTEDIEEYLDREIRTYNPDAWVDDSKTKIGYEIPFSRIFYDFVEMQTSAELEKDIEELETNISSKMKTVFGGLSNAKN